MNIDFYGQLQHKCKKYSVKYGKFNLSGIVRILIFFVQYSIFKLPFLILENIKSEIFYSRKKQSKVLFIASGGIGDFCIVANYIEYFYKFSKIKHIDVCDVNPNKKILQTVFAANYITCTELDNGINYDIVIELRFRFPKVVKVSKNVKRVNPKLYGLLTKYKTFYKENSYFYDSISASSVNRYCLLRGQKRIQQPDLYGILNIKEDYLQPLKISLNEESVLEKFNLSGKAFIVIHKGTDAAFVSRNSTKEWGVAQFNELVVLLKKKYASYPLVQLGTDLNDKIKGIDFDLRGKTSLEELKVLLKRAKMLIDQEGGYVHLRKFLGGKTSVVIFGPTDPNVYGYEGNISIRANDTCPIVCEWITDDWMKKCLRQDSGVPCMEAVTAKRVFDEIQKSGVI